MSVPSAHQRGRRSRIFMVVVLGCILAVVGTLYVALQNQEKQSQRLHKGSFIEYVKTRHLGYLTTIDDGTGLDPSSYILTLNQPVSDAHLSKTMVHLMHEYQQLDHGQILTVVYTDKKTGQQRALADIEYDDDTHQLNMTLYFHTGRLKHIKQREDW